MQHHDMSLTIEELAEQTQTSVRTIRYYIAENLLPGPGARGKGAAYTEDHLLRLQLIRRLTERRTPLAEIREMLARMSLDEIRALLAEEATLSEQRASREVSPRAYISALLDQARATSYPQKAPYMPPSRPVSPARSPQASPYPKTPATTPSAWRRVEIVPGVELHIQEDREPQNQRIIERLLAVEPDEVDTE